MKEGPEARGNPSLRLSKSAGSGLALPGQVPNRRVFLIAGALFVAGTWLGVEGGYALGVAHGASPADPELPPTDDADLAEMRRLAVLAPIAELVEKRLVFTNLACIEYRGDTIVWKGIERLCKEVLANPNFEDRRLFARLMAQIIELGPPEMVRPMVDCVPMLRCIR